MRVWCAGLASRLWFEDSARIIEARQPEDLTAAFSEVEAALEAGYYVAGYASYELGAELVPKQRRFRDRTLPLLRLGVYSVVAAEPSHAPRLTSIGPLVPGVARSAYRNEIARIVAAIGEGDVYQVNYAVPFDFAFTAEPAEIYAAVNRDGTYPYAAYVECDEYALVSCSPELFVRREPAGRVVTKPMKGTAARERTAELADAKNRAEHIMIVDLLRNDLHRLSRNVEVARLLDVETYPGYATMTSTLCADVEPSLTFEALLRAMFPCGSVTGAPKVAAMQQIAHSEQRPRGIFCGSIGYLAPDRTGVWNVAIRTATLDRQTGRGTLFVGGGIVADSTADAEWAEILTKRASFARIAPDYALIETFACAADGSHPLLALHLARLGTSADALHFTFDERKIRTALAAYSSPGPHIVRLQLERDGTFELTQRPLTACADVAVCFATQRVSVNEPLHCYKTTWRPHYDAALAAARAVDCFDAILCNERGEIADGARTNVFVRRGERLVTPPLDSGALPGILRARLLAQGSAVEERLLPSDLVSAGEFYVGNSVRGLLRAQLRPTHAATP